MLFLDCNQTRDYEHKEDISKKIPACFVENISYLVDELGYCRFVDGNLLTLSGNC